jgi:hypothetical protein
MAPTATQPPTRARRSSTTEKRKPNGNRPKGEQRQSGEFGEQDLPRESRRPARGARRTVKTDPMMAAPRIAESGGDRLERADAVKSATSTANDVLGPVLAGWGQVYTSMLELAFDMVKLQQRTFATMLGVTGNARGVSGDRRVDDAVSPSRTRSMAPDEVEHDRS